MIMFPEFKIMVVWSIDFKDVNIDISMTKNKRNREDKIYSDIKFRFLIL